MQRIASLVCLVAMFFPAHADAQSLYGGAGIGSVQIEDDGPGYFVSDFASAWRVHLGYEANSGLAFEGVILNSRMTDPSNDTTATRADFSGFALYAVGSTPTSEYGRFAAKLGLFTGQFRIESATRSFDDRKNGAALGLAYIFDFTDQVALRGDFETYFSSVETLSNGSISVQVRFGN